jgi:uncharacterized membrane protein YidH (DUF202 family)
MNRAKIMFTLRAVFAGAATILVPTAVSAQPTSASSATGLGTGELLASLLIIIGLSLNGLGLLAPQGDENVLRLGFNLARLGFGLFSAGLIVLAIIHFGGR